MHDAHTTQRATQARDVALRRLRRFTGGLIAGAVALTGAFAGVAASSTHKRQVLVRTRREARRATTVTTPPLPPVPAAPEQAAAPPPAPAPPAAAPVSTPAPPVVVSGGS
jgi:predicted lipid-binding transport protein (Tim44 family)